MKRQENGEPKPSRPIFRLLLHAVDGIFPYVTIDHLERCFPANQHPELMVGLAVRDTCLTPLYVDEPEKGKKPRGYTFSDSVSVSSNLLPYRRVTVPTFDSVLDANSRTCGSNKNRSKHKHASIYLWTQNGRQPLSLDQYQRISTSLDSHYTVSFFDPDPPTHPHDTQPSKRGTVRKSDAWQKLRDWFESSNPNSNDNQKLWMPFPVSGKWGETEQVHWEWMQQQQSDTVALIHWNHIPEYSVRQDTLKTVLSADNRTNLAVLATSNVEQICQLLSMSKSTSTITIGTNLPTLWAQAKVAFVVPIAALLRRCNNDVGKKNADITDPQWDANGCIDLNPPTTSSSTSKDDHHRRTHSWFADPSPLVHDCLCPTCTRHSRAYLYHLVCSNELLAEILLFVHNLHHLLALIRACNAANGHS